MFNSGKAIDFESNIPYYILVEGITHVIVIWFHGGKMGIAFSVHHLIEIKILLAAQAHRCLERHDLPGNLPRDQELHMAGPDHGLHPRLYVGHHFIAVLS